VLQFSYQFKGSAEHRASENTKVANCIVNKVANKIRQLLFRC